MADTSDDSRHGGCAMISVKPRWYRIVLPVLPGGVVRVSPFIQRSPVLLPARTPRLRRSVSTDFALPAAAEFVEYGRDCRLGKRAET